MWEQDGRVERVRLVEQGLTIGRSPDNPGYRTDNSSVSRVHCRLAKGSGAWTVVDLGSKMGTRVNGREVHDDPIPVRSGDVILLGAQDGGLTAQLVLDDHLMMMSLDLTLDEGIDREDQDDAGQTRITSWKPIDHIRTTYDLVAERYSNELADEMLARPVERGLLLAFAELAASCGAGPVGDIGCGPGHIAQHLAGLGLDMVGIDISPAMIAVARSRFPAGQFWIGSMQQLPFPTNAWTSAVSIWATLHSDAEARGQTFRELSRVVRRGGYLLHSFFISAPDQPPGSVYRLERWFDFTVALDTYFVGIDEATAELTANGFKVSATLVREPLVSTELPARRCYLLAQRV